VPAQQVPPSEPPDAEFPFLLNTGRIYHQYHSGTMSRKCPTLEREAACALLQLNPADAKSLGIRAGETVRLTSRRGSIDLAAELTAEVAPGSVYTTFHYHEAPINRLTTAAADPKAKCPEYKICAVRVEKISAHAVTMPRISP